METAIIALSIATCVLAVAVIWLAGYIVKLSSDEHAVDAYTARLKNAADDLKKVVDSTPVPQ